MPGTPLDTSMGGAASEFPQTWWSSAIGGVSPATEVVHERLRQILSQYWRPIYKYIRLSGSRSVDEAKDLTQEFFCHMLQRDLVSRYRPTVGRFRAFLKGAIKTFLAEQHRAGMREKRGGGVVVIPIEVAAADDPEQVADGRESTAEEVFDRQWAEDVMTQALKEFRRECLENGSRRMFEVFEARDLVTGTAPSYEDLATRFGGTVAQIRHLLEDARARLQELLKLKLQEYVSSRDELVDELRDLYS